MQVKFDRVVYLPAGNGISNDFRTAGNFIPQSMVALAMGVPSKSAAQRSRANPRWQTRCRLGPSTARPSKIATDKMTDVTDRETFL